MFNSYRKLISMFLLVYWNLKRAHCRPYTLYASIFASKLLNHPTHFDTIFTNRKSDKNASVRIRVLLIARTGNKYIRNNVEFVDIPEGQPCIIAKTEEMGRCRRVSDCTKAINELKKQENPTICSFDKRDVIVCCEDRFPGPFTTEAPYKFLTTTSSPVSLLRNQEDTSISRKKCLEYTTRKYERPTFNSDIPALDYEEIGGEDAEEDEFAHMAAVAWKTLNGSLAFNCGGSLISDRFVLTAAHCTKAVGTNFVQEEPSIVRLGRLNLFYESEDTTSMDVPIKKIIPHPQYNSPKRYYDIALLELSRSVKFSSSIRPACLWSERDFEHYKEAISTGWGTNESGKLGNTAILQKVNLDLINESLCDNLLVPYRNRLWRGLRDHQMCAGVLEGGRDACQGDSGGPLQVKDEKSDINVYHIVGITSFGKHCAQPEFPGVYTRVSHFVPWIESIVWPNS